MNYYEILGVEKSASAKEIRVRFRSLARKAHPDRVPDEEKAAAEKKFQDLTEAVNVLTNDKQRQQHDQELEGGRSTQQLTDFTKIAKAYQAKGVKAFRAGDYVQARENFDLAVKHDPADPKGFHNLALACVRIPSGLRQAVQAIESAVRLDSMNPNYLKEAGAICRKAGLVAKAERYYVAALEWDSENPDIQIALSELREQKGKKEAKSGGLLGSFRKKG